jgi:transcription initiation factor TFIIIB Brf1 subunit/transcription initiation factor TFIIB
LVAAAAGAKAYAERQYREAVLAASAQHSQRAIAEVAGVTQQTIQRMQQMFGCQTEGEPFKERE